jgi:hypothetical protein
VAAPPFGKARAAYRPGKGGRGDEPPGGRGGQWTSLMWFWVMSSAATEA